MTKGEIKKLDSKWRIIINSRGKCEVCEKPTGEVRLNAHHYIGRRNYNVRWYIENGVCLCVAHHTMSPTSAHQNTEWFRSIMIQKRGQEWLDELNISAGTEYKGDYELINEYLDEYK